MSPDDWLTVLSGLPPVRTDEELLPDGTLLIHFRGARPPYVDGGTLVIPAGTVFSG